MCIILGEIELVKGENGLAKEWTGVILVHGWFAGARSVMLYCNISARAFC